MGCELYARCEATGVVVKAPVKNKSNGNGREFMKFILGVPNPKITNNSKEWTYFECTVWDINLIRKMSTSYPQRKDVINVQGEFFIQTYNCSSYGKIFVRDYRIISITEVNDEENKFTDLDNTVQEFNENSNAEDMVTQEDYNKSF